MRPHLADAKAVITRNRGFSAEAISLAPNLIVIGSHGTGIDSIDTDAARGAGIEVVNTPGANAQAVAEHTLALMLACAKSLPAADAAVRHGEHDFRSHHRTAELGGKVLGLVGYGRIARRVASICAALGMEVCAYTTHASPERLARDGVRRIDDLDDLCRRTDVVSLHGLPAGGQLFDERRIALLKPGCIFVNTARGSLVDEDALAAALLDGTIAAAALDVFDIEPLPLDSRLLDCPNLVLTPHIGGLASEAMERTAVMVAQRVLEILDKRRLTVAP